MRLSGGRFHLIARRALALGLAAVLLALAGCDKSLTASPSSGATVPEVLPPEGELIGFSIEEAYVQPGAALELTLGGGAGEGATIHYTLNGSTPTAESPVYEGPITLAAPEGRGCWPVKAAVLEGGQASEVFQRCYFPADTAVLGEGLVAVSITGEPDDFYSEETGILALGAESEEAALADESLPLNFRGDKRANYYGRGAEWERPVTVDIYDAAGQLLLHQGAGVRVTGGATRDFAQKSLRLYARRDYDAVGTFTAAIFGDLYGGEGDPAVTKFNHIDLRSGGDDWYFTMLGDATSRMLAGQAGLLPMGLPRPAVVYLNGEYYGLAWMQPDYHEKNIAWNCGLEDHAKVEVLEAFALPFAEGILQNPELPEALAEYDAMYALALEDLTIPENAEALEAMVDMDNFFLYYALEMYFNNVDWPHNNYKVWRYAGATEEEKQQNPYADGRWRFLMYDTDCAYGTYNETVDGFEWLLAQGHSPMLQSVLRNEDFRARFASTWCALMASTLSSANVGTVVDAAAAMIEPEMRYREEADPVTFDAALRGVMLEKIDLFLERRPAEVAAGLATYCGARSPYTLTLTCPEGAAAAVGGARLGPGVTEGTFYREAPLTLTALPGQGQAFAGWRVDGEVVDTPTLRLEVQSDAAEIELLMD